VLDTVLELVLEHVQAQLNVDEIREDVGLELVVELVFPELEEGVELVVEVELIVVVVN
jgi:hypothetical protein